MRIRALLNGRRPHIGLASIAAIALVLTACSSGDPFASNSPGVAENETITVGSAGFAESEIIAEIYAQALQAKGIEVKKNLSIGQRDVYLAALADGSIDLIPEYSGNLLQFYDAESTASSSEEVYAALGQAIPDDLLVLQQARAEDKDSYNVTTEFAAEHDLKSLSDLAGLGIPLVVGGNPELRERPYGPGGLTEVYGVASDLLSFQAYNDSGGPLTVRALIDGTVQLADIFSTAPAIAENKFVTLDDPENMILPQNVLPLINKGKAGTDVVKVLNEVSAQLTTEDLIELNSRNQGEEKASPAVLARDWLVKNNLD
ncbi:glycine betaine ABC transporter substrate-binding protein [Lysinibacter sp. HNR]|uniref:ABC transporter substrate-binding protein n=1 Tax=Lysinibacter sp. HNR TaxID=3031408 RepID=UPI002434A83A|nr:glycine betaine ABC transporter substrate-binding protein [Lysinibacter sp. HNR]WGD38337.1 glycine betaine ABC transporter substrate-binding protein [Lysinibacter sp. HNR]